MINGLEIYGSSELLLKLKNKKPFFICTIATTATATIPNITGAGASPELMEYTPAGDVELIIQNEVLCCDIPPQTITDDVSAPTPAILSKASIELTGVPFLVLNAGSKIKPNVPYILINDIPGGNIQEGNAVENPKKIFEYSKIIAKEISKNVDYLVLGESIPGGTTTALGVLTALGYDANFKISGSIPENPHNLKKEVVLKGIANSNINIGETDPFEVVKAVGDPMIPAIAGMVFASEVPVILAGGTQMAAVCAFIKGINPNFDFSNLCLGTTCFVVNDNSSDLINIISQIGDIAIYAVNPEFEKSTNLGLRNYLKGFVKEGVGAGGSMLMALLLGHSIEDLREKMEEILK